MTQDSLRTKRFDQSRYDDLAGRENSGMRSEGARGRPLPESVSRILPLVLVSLVLAFEVLLGIAIYREAIGTTEFFRSLALNAPQIALAIVVALGLLAALSRDGSP